MENLHLQAVYEGFREPQPNSGAREAFMTTLGYENEKMLITSEPVVLWTKWMSDCRAVATYTPGMGKRTLTHLAGGNAEAVYFQTLWPLLTPESHIIVVAGGNDSPGGGDRFKTQSMKFYRENFDSQLREAGMAKPPPFENYVPCWPDAVPNQKLTGFVFKPDGRYGILNPNGEP